MSLATSVLVRYSRVRYSLFASRAGISTVRLSVVGVTSRRWSLAMQIRSSRYDCSHSTQKTNSLPTAFGPMGDGLLTLCPLLGNDAGRHRIASARQDDGLYHCRLSYL